MSETEESGIKEEADLARLLTTHWNIGTGECFSKVKIISRNLRVSPDIDLLRVYVNQHQPDKNTSTGFELKVLNYHSRRKRIGLEPFYQGIGQVLTYFEHGIDRAALVVGFHHDAVQHKKEVKDAEDLLKKHCSFLESSVFAGFPYIQIYLMKDRDLTTLVSARAW